MKDRELFAKTKKESTDLDILIDPEIKPKPTVLRVSV